MNQPLEQTNSGHHDPDVLRVLNNMSDVRHQRDGLILDKQDLERKLNQADSTVAELRAQLERALAQRDTLMAKNVELATLFSTILHAVKQAELGFQHVARVAATPTASEGGAVPKFITEPH